MLADLARPGFTKREASYEDLLAVPDHKVAEILEGELYVSPRPAVPHAVALEMYRLWGHGAPEA